MTPRTFGGQVFCVAYAIIGIPLMGFVLTTVYTGVMMLYKVIVRKFGVCRRPHKDTSIKQRFLLAFIVLLFAFTVLIILPAVFFYYFEGWDFWEATYYCFITISTIGFGDFVVGNYPDHSEITRWILKIGAVIYITMGLSFMMALGKLAENELRRTGNRRKAYRVKMKNTMNRPSLQHTKHVCADGSVWTVKDTKYTAPLCTINDNDVIGNGDLINESESVSKQTVHETAFHFSDNNSQETNSSAKKRLVEKEVYKGKDGRYHIVDPEKEEHMTFSVSSLMMAANAFDD